MIEEWRTIKGYDGLYEVSNLGRVKSNNLRCHKEPIILKYSTTKDGYLRVCLTKNSKQKRFLVHRLVAVAFIDNPNNFDMVNHKDENKSNNRVDNLEWCNNSYNQLYSLRLHPERKFILGNNFRDKKTGESLAPKGARKRKEPIVLLDEQGNIKASYKDSITARNCTGLKDGHIYYVCERNMHTFKPKNKNHISRANGNIFCFDNELDIEHIRKKLLITRAQ